jgi:hypothetical protein
MGKLFGRIPSPERQTTNIMHDWEQIRPHLGGVSFKPRTIRDDSDPLPSPPSIRAYSFDENDSLYAFSPARVPKHAFSSSTRRMGSEDDEDVRPLLASSPPKFNEKARSKCSGLLSSPQPSTTVWRGMESDSEVWMPRERERERSSYERVFLQSPESLGTLEISAPSSSIGRMVIEKRRPAREDITTSIIVTHIHLSLIMSFLYHSNSRLVYRARLLFHYSNR